MTSIGQMRRFMKEYRPTPEEQQLMDKYQGETMKWGSVGGAIGFGLGFALMSFCTTLFLSNSDQMPGILIELESFC